jgi:hypothetical protein
MTFRKILLPALVVLLLSSAGMRRTAQGQTNSPGLSGSWIGLVTLSPELAAGLGASTTPIMLTYSSNGTVTEVIQGAACGGNDSVGVGAWVSTGNGQFAQTTNHYNCDHMTYIGNFKLRASLTVNGNQMSGNVEVLFSDTTGAPQGGGAGSTFAGTQIAVETIGSK